MEHRQIGSLSVSVVGVGCNNFGGRLDQEATTAVVHAALDAGVNFFDTADVYGEGRSEVFLGEALAGRRDEGVVATKFGAMADEGYQRGSPEWIAIAADRSLEKLQVETIDLYQLHFPDPDVPAEETLGALNELVVAGKVREIGISNAGSTLLNDTAATAQAEGWASYASVQNRYSMLTRDAEAKVLPACRDLGLAFLPYFPLESGLLSGKYTSRDDLPEGTRLAGMDDAARERFLDDARWAKVEALRDLSEQLGRSMLSLAVTWLLSHAEVASVIAGATRPEQVRANVDASTAIPLTPADRTAIDSILGDTR